MLVPIYYYELVRRDKQLVVQMVYATFRLIFLISIFSQVFFFDTEIELPLVTQFSRRLFD